MIMDQMWVCKQRHTVINKAKASRDHACPPHSVLGSVSMKVINLVGNVKAQAVCANIFD